jgi:hypothetical protein
MLLNDNRGSFGMFSRAGRNSAEKYNILGKKDEILGGMNKKIQLKDLFTPDDHVKNTEDGEDDIDIFKTETNMKKELKRAKLVGAKRFKKVKKDKAKSEIAKYLEMRKQAKKKMENPACTKYNPKNEYIWKRTLTGPQWEQSERKNFAKIKKEEVEPKFYKFHTDFEVKGKNFVDLARQTRRASFSGNTNVRVQNLKSSKDPEKDFASTHYVSSKGRTSMSTTSKGRTSNAFFNANRASVLNKDIMEVSAMEKNNTYTDIDSEGEVSEMKQRRKTKLNPINKDLMSNTTSGNNRWVKIQAPDFKKIISREQLEKIYGDKRTIIPFSFPNFKWTRPSKNFLNSNF